MLIILLRGINLVYFINLLIITSITLHFYRVLGLINYSNLIIKFIVTSLYRRYSNLQGYSKLQSLCCLILFYQHLLHLRIISCVSFLRCAIKQYRKTLFIIVLTPRCLYSSNSQRFCRSSYFYFSSTQTIVFYYACLKAFYLQQFNPSRFTRVS